MGITIPNFSDSNIWKEDESKMRLARHDERKRAWEVFPESPTVDEPTGELVGVFTHYDSAESAFGGFRLAGSLLEIFGVQVVMWWGTVGEEERWTLQAVRMSDGTWRCCPKDETKIHFVFDDRHRDGRPPKKTKPHKVHIHVHGRDNVELFRVTIERGRDGERGKIVL